MSGGSLNYVYHQVDEVAERFRESKNPHRRAFGDHLKKVAKALHDIEWVISDDYDEGEDIEAIEACITPESILKSGVDDANETITRLQELIKLYDERMKKWSKK